MNEETTNLQEPQKETLKDSLIDTPYMNMVREHEKHNNPEYDPKATEILKLTGTFRLNPTAKSLSGVTEINPEDISGIAVDCIMEAMLKHENSGIIFVKRIKEGKISVTDLVTMSCLLIKNFEDKVEGAMGRKIAKIMPLGDSLDDLLKELEIRK